MFIFCVLCLCLLYFVCCYYCCVLVEYTYAFVAIVISEPGIKSARVDGNVSVNKIASSMKSHANSTTGGVRKDKKGGGFMNLIAHP
jgi:hypothetical protein